MSIGNSKNVTPVFCESLVFKSLPGESFVIIGQFLPKLSLVFFLIRGCFVRDWVFLTTLCLFVCHCQVCVVCLSPVCQVHHSVLL